MLRVFPSGPGSATPQTATDTYIHINKRIFGRISLSAWNSTNRLQIYYSHKQHKHHPHSLPPLNSPTSLIPINLSAIQFTVGFGLLKGCYLTEIDVYPILFDGLGLSLEGLAICVLPMRIDLDGIFWLDGRMLMLCVCFMSDGLPVADAFDMFLVDLIVVLFESGHI